MLARLDCLNGLRKPKSLACRNDLWGRKGYAGVMKPKHDWYLGDWLRTLGKRQADLVRDLDWNKARVSLMMRGTQQYTRDAINELAEYLNLRPFELLLHPDEAMALRRLQGAAEQIVAIAHESDERANGTTG